MIVEKNEIIESEPLRSDMIVKINGSISLNP